MFSSRKVEKNYDVYSWFTHYIPAGMKGMFSLLLWLLLGALIGNIVTLVFLPFGQEAIETYGTLVAYPIMFLPAMMMAKSKSQRNAVFDQGIKLDNNYFSPFGGLTLAVLVMVATFAASFIMDFPTSLLPPMPEILENALSGLTEGNFFLNFLAVSIFAPFFEEWLCRGMVLRGLLNYKKVSADGTTRSMDPKWAIIWSAVFFGVIHLNPWQALPAMVLGCLFGYVYYKTGSLKLTMLMHFTNNTISLICGQIDSTAEAETWLDIMPVPVYAVIAVLCAAFLWWFFQIMKKVQLQRPEGNFEVIEAEA